MSDFSARPLEEVIYVAYALALRRDNTSVADQLLRALELLAAQSGENAHLDAAYALIEQEAGMIGRLQPRKRSTY